LVASARSRVPIRSRFVRNSALGVSRSRMRANESVTSGWSTSVTVTGIVCAPMWVEAGRSPSERTHCGFCVEECVARLDQAVDDAEPLRERCERRLHGVDREPLEVAEPPAERLLQLRHLAG